MKQLLLSIFFLSAFINLFSQAETFTFLPKWKVGDKKIISVFQRSKSITEDGIKEDSVQYLDREVLVIGEDKNYYTLQVNYENIALRTVVERFTNVKNNAIGDLTGYKRLLLKYRVNRHTFKADLTNWKEVHDSLQWSFDQVTQKVKDENPKAAIFIEDAFNAIFS